MTTIFDSVLGSKELEELPSLQSRFPDPKALANELIQRGWLTPYQANLLLQGRGQELILGPYILMERLGKGGMGQVFKARHRKLDRIVAIKLIRKERLESPDVVRRFEREIRAVAALSHPNIVRALDADNIGGTHLLVMEYIEGANDLAKLVKKNGPLPVPRACEFIRQAALGLQHAYERELVHRDIKPANLLLTPDGKTIKVLDMGLARLDSGGDDKTSTMTHDGALLGTPDYIAPEQAVESHTVDIRADLYSLGCSFYFLLTGQVPFPGGTLLQKLNKHQSEEPQPVERLRPEVPPNVAMIVRKLMAKKPTDRYQTPATLASALGDLQQQSSVTSPGNQDTLASGFEYMAKRDDTVALAAPRPKRQRRRWLLGVLVSVAVVAVTSFFVFQGSSERDPTKHFKNGIGMDFVWISPGTFMMGSPEKEVGRGPSEAQHKVTLTKGFYLGVNEVSQEQWQAVMGNNPSKIKGKSLPVDNVSWNDCQDFLNKLGRKEGHAYRLPSEAEWEYACRAGTETAFSFGEKISRDYVAFNNSLGRPTPVGGFPPNAWGLYDMHGNLWEWCADRLGVYPQFELVDPQGPDSAESRVLRGGSFDGQAFNLRSAVRLHIEPTRRSSNFGFRAARTFR